MVRMSLYKATDGLLGTHVTWHDVETEMQGALGTTARFGPGRKVTNISEMKGFMSRIAMIEPDWSSANEEDLPEKFVVKISSQLPFIEINNQMYDQEEFLANGKLEKMGEVTRMMHNREVAAYQLLMTEKRSKVPFNKIYALRAFDEKNHLKGYIIQEYVLDAHHYGMHESVPVEDLLPIIRAIASFSAIGEKRGGKETEFARGPGFLDIVFGQFMDEKTIQQTERMCRESFSGEYQEKVEKMLDINRKYFANHNMLPRFKTTSEFFGYRPVLTHSDIWSSNFLCTRDNEGHMSLKAIIDYQTVSFSTPAQDVGRLFVVCLSKKDRREKLDWLLEEYYKTFVEELDGAPVPYTLQQLKDSYQVFFPLQTMMVLPEIVPMLELLQCTEEYRESARRAAMDKMVGLLEDLIATHESNLQRFPKYFQF